MRRTKKPVRHTRGCNQQNPDFRKLHRTKGPASSTNTLKGKKKKSIDGGICRLIESITVYGLDSNKLYKNYVLVKSEKWNPDWIFDGCEGPGFSERFQIHC